MTVANREPRPPIAHTAAACRCGGMFAGLKTCCGTARCHNLLSDRTVSQQLRYKSCQNRPRRPRDGYRYSSTLSLTLELDGVGGRRHAPAALSPGKDPVRTVLEGGWAPGPVWTGAGNVACWGFELRTVEPLAGHHIDCAANTTWNNNNKITTNSTTKTTAATTKITNNNNKITTNSTT